MGKRHEKGVIWIVALILLCMFLVYFLKNPSHSTAVTDKYVNSEMGMVNNDISLTDTSESSLLISEQEDLWILFDQLSFEREENPVGTVFFAGLLIAYIIFIGPVIYFFLKRKERMEWMWMVIPCASIVFAGMIILLGDGFAVKEPVIDTLTVLSPKQQEVIYVAATSPGRQAYSLDLDDKVNNITPLYVSGEYDLYGDSLIQKERGYSMEINEDGVTLNLEPRRAFSRDYFYLEGNHSQSGKIAGSVSLEKEQLSGTLENATDWNFPVMIVCWQDQYCVISDFEKEKSISLEKQIWETVEDSWEGPRMKGSGLDKDCIRILRLAYLKYYEAGQPDTVWMAAVIPEYETHITNANENMVSYGVFHQWEETK